MSRLFTCDKCGTTSPHPFDEEKYPNEDGVLQTYDLCAPCRKDLGNEKDKAHKQFFKKGKK